MFSGFINLDATGGLLHLLLVLIGMSTFVLQLEQQFFQAFLQFAVVLGLQHSFPGNQIKNKKKTRKSNPNHHHRFSWKTINVESRKKDGKGYEKNKTKQKQNRNKLGFVLQLLF